MVSILLSPITTPLGGSIPDANAQASGATSSNSKNIKSDIVVEANEIVLQGEISAIDFEKKQFTLQVSSFALPSGKTSRFAAPKPKTIVLTGQTSVHRRGAVTEKIAVDAMQTGLYVLVVGRDSGSGEPLTARDVALWSRVEGNTFLLGNPVAPAAVSPSTNQTVKTATRQVRNELKYGNFEQFDDKKRLVGWSLPGGKNIKLVQEGGNHYVAVSSDDLAQYRSFGIKVRARADWKVIRLSARLSTRGMQPGEQIWENAHVGITFEDATGKVLNYGAPAGLSVDSDWKRVSITNMVPPGTQNLYIDAGNWGRAGTVFIDDIVVEANPSFEARDIAPSFPEGTFEKVDDSGNPDGWDSAQAFGVQVLEENGNHYLRLTNRDPGASAFIHGFFKLDPEWRMVRVRSRLRVKDLKMGAQPWEIARLGYVFTDEAGNQAGDYTNSPGVDADTDWKVIEIVAPVHPGAALIKLTPILNNATGVLDIDDIVVEPVWK
ncbi:MAG TPA: hypothetical protein VF600_00205 [Abditibacteriaceae bacterium]